MSIASLWVSALRLTLRQRSFIHPEHSQIVNNINAYLLDADNIFVESRSEPICDVPEIGMGNQPIDDGNYLFTKKEQNDYIKKEPAAKKKAVSPN